MIPVVFLLTWICLLCRHFSFLCYKNGDLTKIWFLKELIGWLLNWTFCLDGFLFFCSYFVITAALLFGKFDSAPGFQCVSVFGKNVFNCFKSFIFLYCLWKSFQVFGTKESLHQMFFSCKWWRFVWHSEWNYFGKMVGKIPPRKLCKC